MSIASVGRVSDVALDGRHQRAERSRTAVVDGGGQPAPCAAPAAGRPGGGAVRTRAACSGGPGTARAGGRPGGDRQPRERRLPPQPRGARRRARRSRRAPDAAGVAGGGRWLSRPASPRGRPGAGCCPCPRARSGCAALGLGRIALVTHDMGDSVGGELLARDLDGDLDFEISRRVLANGSVYLELAQLTPGQLFLLDLPDARLEPPAQRSAGERPAGERDEGAAMRTALAATFAPDHQPGPDELAAQWALIARNDGHHLLPRTVRFLDGE